MALQDSEDDLAGEVVLFLSGCMASSPKTLQIQAEPP